MQQRIPLFLLRLALAVAGGTLTLVSAWAPRVFLQRRGNVVLLEASQQQPVMANDNAPPPPPTVLNGKRVMPLRILTAGLKGQPEDQRKIAAVYALLSSDYSKGTEGWEAVVHVGVTQDLAQTLPALGNVEFTHVRALSFSFPQPNAMQDVADSWKRQAQEAGAEFATNVVDASLFLVDDDDDDEFDDDDDEWSMEDIAQATASVPRADAALNDGNTVVSPFEDKEQTENRKEETMELPTVIPSEPGSLELNQHTVDFILNEVRPYLIADGGNCTVKDVDVDSKTVFLKLEGACGSCPSSTVTMQMGIERVLKENFGPDVKVEQVQDPDDPSKPTSLTMEMVQEEVDRLKPAIVAMGGVVRVLSVDDDTGLVELQFRGASRVQQGLELAILDLPFVNAVQFVMGQDD